MSKTIFQHIANVTHIKADSNKYSQSDWQSYSPYMMNRWLSMCKEYADLIDNTQKYYNLSKELHYKMLCSLLPKQKIFTKYIKSKNTKNHNPDLISALTKHYEVSKTQVKSYLQLAFEDELLILNIKNILEKYGYSEIDIKKLLK